MPIFDVNGKLYRVKENDVVAFGKANPEAVTKLVANNEEWEVAAKDYNSFAGEHKDYAYLNDEGVPGRWDNPMNEILPQAENLKPGDPGFGVLATQESIPQKGKEPQVTPREFIRKQVGESFAKAEDDMLGGILAKDATHAATYNALQKAKNTIGISDNNRDGKSGAYKLANTLWKRVSEDVTGVNAFLDNPTVMKAASKVREDGSGYDELPEDEQRLLDAVVLKNAAEQYFGEDASVWDNMGSMTAESIPFMMQMFLTKGVYSGVSKAAQAGLKGVAAKLSAKLGASTAGATQGIGGALAGTAARTPLMTQMWSDAFARMTGTPTPDITPEGVKVGAIEDREHPMAAIGKGFVSGFNENLSEQFGEALPFIGKAVKSNGIAKFFGGMSDKYASNFLKRLDELPISESFKKLRPGFDVVNKIARDAGFHGVPSEAIEEYFNLGLDQITLREQDPKEFFSKESQLTMLGSFAITGGALSGMNLGVNAAQKYGISRGYKNAWKDLSNLGFSQEAIEGLNDNISKMTPKEVMANLYDFMDNPEYTFEEKHATRMFTLQALRYNAMKAANEGAIEEKADQAAQQVVAQANPDTGLITYVKVVGEEAPVKLVGNNVPQKQDGTPDWNAVTGPVYVEYPDGSRKQIQPRMVEQILSNDDATAAAEMARQQEAAKLQQQETEMAEGQSFEIGTPVRFLRDGETIETEVEGFTPEGGIILTGVAMPISKDALTQAINEQRDSETQAAQQQPQAEEGTEAQPQAEAQDEAQQNPEQTAQADVQAEPEITDEEFLAVFPKDKKGSFLFEEAKAADTVRALSIIADNDLEFVVQQADAMLEGKQRELAKLVDKEGKQKMVADINKNVQNKLAIKQINQSIDYWNTVRGQVVANMGEVDNDLNEIKAKAQADVQAEEQPQPEPVPLLTAPVPKRSRFQGETDEEYDEYILNESDDLDEIANAHDWMRKNEELENTLEPWQEELLSHKFSRKSFIEFGDKNYIGRNIAINWLVPDKEAKGHNRGLYTIDTAVQEISEMSGQEVTPQMVIDYILSNPTKKRIGNSYAKSKEIARRFSELATQKMGIKIGGPASASGRALVALIQSEKEITIEEYRNSLAVQAEEEAARDLDLMEDAMLLDYEFTEDETISNEDLMAMYADQIPVSEDIAEIISTFDSIEAPNTKEDGPVEESDQSQGDNDSPGAEVNGGEQVPGNEEGVSEADREAEGQTDSAPDAGEQPAVAPIELQGKSITEISKKAAEKQKEEKKSFVAPKTVRELYDLDAEDRSGYGSAIVLNSLNLGDTIVIGGKKYTVTRKTKPSKEVGVTTKGSSYERMVYGLTLTDEKGRKVTGKRWDDYILDGKRMSSTWLPGNGWESLSRDIDGDVSIDLINEYNQMHDTSDSFKRIQKYLDDEASQKPKRFEEGKKLTDKEKKEVLATMKDSYKEMNRERSLEATPDGNERLVWKGEAGDYMAVSDITGRKIRWYITMPDGKIAHPTELYPDLTDAEINAAADSLEYHAQQYASNYKKGSKLLEVVKDKVISQLEKALNAGLTWAKTYDGADVARQNPDTRIRTKAVTEFEPNGMVMSVKDYMGINDMEIPDLHTFDWERYYNDNKGNAQPASNGEAEDAKPAANEKEEEKQPEPIKPSASLFETAKNVTEAVRNQAESTERIEDFGEKIGGARKDQIKKYFDKINLNGKILSVIFPKPDIKALLESGLSVKDVSGIKVAYEFATQDKKKGAEYIKFYAAYAKSILAESINLEYTNSGYVFTDYGKSQIELRVKAYQSIHDQLGADYLSLDLTKAKIREADKSGRTRYFRGGEPIENANYIVQYYVSSTNYFETLEDAIAEFVNQIKKNTTTGTIEYKRKLGLYSDRHGKNNGFYIAYSPRGKDLIKLYEGIKTLKEAREVFNNSELIAELHLKLERILAEQKEKNGNETTKPRLKYTNETARDRVGKDWRKGNDIGSKELAETFGFRAIEFGNWVNQKERQIFVNNTYDSLMDLAQLLGISPKAISLGGKLGLTFGSRGSGNATAHFEPDRRIINLTKTKGLGSLAHEWWHAIDNYFNDFSSTAEGMKAASNLKFKDGLRQEVKDVFKKLYEAINNTGGMRKRASRLDSSRNSNYFSLPHEMSARAFENFVLSRLNESGQINDFIVNYISNDDWNGDADKYPFPLPEEAEVINNSFREVFETIEEREDEDGNAILFRDGDSLPATVTINGTERPTTNSQGEPIASDIEGVKAFWEWFSGSDLVDEQGRPIVLYRGHESNNVLDTRLKTPTFTDNREVAQTYANDYAEGKLSKSYVHAKNPLRFGTEEGAVTLKELRELLPAELLETVASAGDWMQDGEMVPFSEASDDAYAESFLLAENPDFITYAKEQGHDALVYSGLFTAGEIDNYTSVEVRPFSSEQVRIEEVGAEIPETINVDGKERPTRNSEGKLIHSTIEGIRNFYAWFGDSKVVDSEGRPLVVYHGTNVRFNAFNQHNRYSFSDSGVNYFTGDKNLAGKYGRIVMPVYLSMQDPDIQNANGKTYNEYANSYTGLGLNAYSETIIENIKDSPSGSDKRVKAQSIYAIGNKNNSQIKSATDNTGAFDSENDDIRFRMLGEVGAANLDAAERKQKQLEIILQSNPMADSYHVGIRGISDIKTFEEAADDPESFVWGDFSKEDAQKALKSGSVTVYSSTPIANGVFVSTSKNQAKDYAGEGNVYEMKVPLSDVAWINGDQGQYAKVEDSERFRKTSPTGFYSTVEEALNGIKQEKGTTDQMKAMLLKNGAKQAELDWMGWEDRFPDGKKTITKAEVQSWIDENRIEVKEVRKETWDEPGDKLLSEFETEVDNLKEILGNWQKWNMFEVEYGDVLMDVQKSQIAEWEDKYGSPDQVEIEIDYIMQNEDNYVSQTSTNTQYSDYQLPGGNNYKEVLLTMPEKRPVPTPEELETQSQSDYKKPYSELSDLLKKEINKQVMANKGYTKDYSPKTFKSSHFDEPNILAHIRFNERSIDGKRVLFIEEVQSDWAQEGRKHGFKGDQENTKAKDAVPNMPFKTTPQWTRLALRRMLRYAVDNGFDQIAWTNGDQQVARYDLSEQIDKIEVTNAGEGIGYNVYAFKGGEKVVTRTATAPELPELVGKELAQKIIDANIPYQKTKIFSGLDLKVGGEGMKAFYDQIIPKEMREVIKPFSGKLTTIEVEKAPVQAVDINEQMKEVVPQGLPLYRDTTPKTTAEQAIEQEAQKMADSLPAADIEIITSPEQITDSDPKMQARKRAAKGWYNPKTGKITVVAYNHEDVADVQATILHEVVAHHGLRGLLGEQFNEFLAKVWESMPASEQSKYLAKYGNKREAAEEYIAAFAENGVDTTLFDRVAAIFRAALRKIGINLQLGEKDIMYVLWLSKNRLTSGTSAVKAAKMVRDGARFREAGEVERNETKIKDTYDRLLTTNWHRLTEAYQNNMESARKVIEQYEKASGKKVQDHENFYLAENAMSSKSTHEMEVFDREYFQPIIDAIAAIMGQRKGVSKAVARKEVTLYMLAKHGEERNEKMNEKKETEGVDYSALEAVNKAIQDLGYTDYEAYIAQFEAKHDTAALWKAINAATKKSLRKWYESGLMSKAAHDEVAKMYDYYIPLRGFESKTAEDVYDYLENRGEGVNSIMKKAKGRSSMPDDPIAHIASMAESAVMVGNRNAMKMHLLRFAQNHKTDLVRIAKVWYVNNGTKENPVWEEEFPAYDEDPDIFSNNVDRFEAEMKEMEEAGMARKDRTGLSVGRIILKKAHREEHMIRVSVNGRDNIMYVMGNPRLAQAINGKLNPDTEVDGALRKIQSANRQLSANFTSRNPAFVVSNFFRDWTMAATIAGVSESPAYVLNQQSAIWGAAKALKHYQKTGQYPGGEMGAMLREFLENGGRTGYTSVHDIEQHKRIIKTELKRADGSFDVLKGARVTARLFEDMNRVVEDINRLATYVASRKAGRSVAKSIADAKNITLNFNRRGSGEMGNKYLRAWFLFVNPAIQSLNNLYERGKVNPIRMGAAIGAYAALGMMVGSGLSEVVSMLLGDDDEENKAGYDDLPEWVRRNNFCLQIGGNFLTIPLAQEFRPFYAVGEIIAQAVRGNMKDRNIGLEIASVLGQVLPFDLVEVGGAAVFGDSKDLALAFAPDALKPIAQVWFNQDFFGVPIQKERYGNNNTPSWRLAYSGTNQALVNATRRLNEATGGDYAKKGWANVVLNPATIEHLFEGYFGGMGKTVNQTAKLIAAGTELATTGKTDLETRNIPVLNRLISTASAKGSFGAINDRYYRLLEKDDKLSGQKRDYTNIAEGSIKGESPVQAAQKLKDLVTSPGWRERELIHAYRIAIEKQQKLMKDARNEEAADQIRESIMQLKQSLIDEVDKLSEEAK